MYANTLKLVPIIRKDPTLFQKSKYSWILICTLPLVPESCQVPRGCDTVSCVWNDTDYFCGPQKLALSCHSSIQPEIIKRKPLTYFCIWTCHMSFLMKIISRLNKEGPLTKRKLFMIGEISGQMEQKTTSLLFWRIKKKNLRKTGSLMLQIKTKKQLLRRNTRLEQIWLNLFLKSSDIFRKLYLLFITHIFTCIHSITYTVYHSHVSPVTLAKTVPIMAN